jgi:hypothetical protein
MVPCSLKDVECDHGCDVDAPGEREFGERRRLQHGERLRDHEPTKSGDLPRKPRHAERQRGARESVDEPTADLFAARGVFSNAILT